MEGAQSEDVVDCSKTPFRVISENSSVEKFKNLQKFWLNLSVKSSSEIPQGNQATRNVAKVNSVKSQLFS